MYLALQIVFFVISAALIGVILLQGPKGEGLGAIGGSARLFHGPRPRETFMTRLTASLGIAWTIGALALVFVR